MLGTTPRNTIEKKINSNNESVEKKTQPQKKKTFHFRKQKCSWLHRYGNNRSNDSNSNNCDNNEYLVNATDYSVCVPKDIFGTHFCNFCQ